jgi:hypothetical protein
VFVRRAIPATATLVLDDVHAASGGDFDAPVSAAIREAPNEVAFAILSRSDPSGVLLEEATRGAIQMLQSSSLTLTAEEAVELLRDRMRMLSKRWASALRPSRRLINCIARIRSLGNDRAAGDTQLDSREYVYAVHRADRVAA